MGILENEVVFGVEDARELLERNYDACVVRGSVVKVGKLAPKVFSGDAKMFFHYMVWDVSSEKELDMLRDWLCNVSSGLVADDVFKRLVDVLEGEDAKRLLALVVKE